MKRIASLIGTLLFILAGAGLLAASAVLIHAHAVAIRDVRDGSLPLAAQVAKLQDRVTVLDRQAEVSRLAASLHTGTEEERLKAYVLPADAGVERAITFLNTLLDHLVARGDMRDVAPFTVADAVPLSLPHAGRGTLKLLSRQITLEFTAKDAGMQDILHVLDLTGLLTLRDGLSDAELQKLLSLTEQENPTGIVSLGQFLSTDLLTYFKDSRPADEKLLGSFSAQTFSREIQSIQEEPVMQEGKALVTGAFKDIFVEPDLWPMPFLRIARIRTEEQPGGWQHTFLKLELVGREGK